MRRLVIASPHRYPDLARLWHRIVTRHIVPGFERAGLSVRTVIFRDATPDRFEAALFPGVTLEAPHSAARDFVEFYDAALSYSSDFVFFLDADVFLLDGAWAASFVAAFDDPAVAAVSFLQRAAVPGVYALLCRTGDFRRLPAPALAATYEDLDNWPAARNRGPGENAAIALGREGKTVINAGTAANGHIADFHGTTVLRASREMFAGAIGDSQFDALVARKRYFLMGAYDNVLLSRVYEPLFAEPFAAGADGDSLTGSYTIPALRRVLRQVDDHSRQVRVGEYFTRSNQAILRLAESQGVSCAIPDMIPPEWPSP